jgi:sulfhydrogenase subunit alpha
MDVKKMTHTINLNHITKIEGHAKLFVEIEDSKIKKCELSSIEGARYFEGLLIGKHWFEAHEITSRICGICSCGHNVAALMAIENALGIPVSEQSKVLKKLLTFGERIRSHAAHLYFLALPDYLGYESALAMTPKYKTEVKRALKLMKIGNDIVRTIGGRDMHQVTATYGGFLKIPTKEQLNDLADRVKGLKEASIETAKLFLSLKQRPAVNECEYFSLYEENDYPMIDGPLVSEKSKFDKDQYLDYFKEYHNKYSTANFVAKDDVSFVTGSLARMNNAFDKLSKDAKKVATDNGFKIPNKNPYNNNVAQAIEIVDALDQVMKICTELDPVDEKPPEVKVKAGHGIGAVEVPRGTLFHEYTLDDKGIIQHANIITPTALNLKNMEDNIREIIPSLLSLKDEEKINLEIEKLIRAYDPCFSCSTHFLKVKWQGFNKTLSKTKPVLFKKE